MAVLPHVASPAEETATSVDGPPAVVQAPQVAGCGVTAIGDWLQWPVAVNCTGVPLALAVAGLTLSDCSSRLPLPPQPPAANPNTAINKNCLSGNLLMSIPSSPASLDPISRLPVTLLAEIAEKSPLPSSGLSN